MALSQKTTTTAIILKGDPRRDEADVTDAAVAPGMWLIRTAGGVKPGDAAADATPGVLMIALPNPWLEAAPPSGEDWPEIAVGDRVHFAVAKKGERYQVWGVDNVNFTLGLQLETAVNGEFQAVTTGAPILEVVEARDLTGNGQEAYIKVEVL